MIKQEARLEAANSDLASAQAQLDEKQAELDEVQALFDAAMSEKQVLCISDWLIVKSKLYLSNYVTSTGVTMPFEK